MKFEATTMKDIAKVLGLSTSTVSRALKDSYEISPETKKLVLDYAKKVNYSPNPIAQSLKDKRSKSIGIIVSEIANSFFSQTINGVESVARAKGYNVLIAQSLESYTKEVSSIQLLASQRIDGCLVSVSTETKDFSHITDLHDRGLHIVCFDRVVDSLETHKVIVNNFQSSYDATTHLIRNGYKNIAIVANSESLSITKERLSGYAKALKDNYMAFHPGLVKHCAHGGMLYDEVETVLQELFRLKRKPDAIFCAADKLTTNCLRYCKINNISIPEHVALIGFSNLDLTDLLKPTLSVVRQPAFEMGRIAAELLIKMIESKRPVTDFETKVLSTEIFERESSIIKKGG